MDLDVRHTLRHVRVPALVVVGEHDRMTPPSSSVALAGELPDGRLEIVERAGHFPMLEEYEEFNRRLEAFADRVMPRRRSKRRSA